MTTRKKSEARLRRQLLSNELVQVRRRTDIGVLTGFVVGLGKKWVMLARVSDGGFFAGHTAVRLREIRDVRLDRGFQTRFAQTQPEWPPALPERRMPIDLDSMRDLLRTFLRVGELVGIESDHKCSALWIGVPDEIVRSWL